VIRPYEARDLEQLLEVFDSASRVGHPFLDETWLQIERRRLPESYLPATETSVFELDGKVVGFIAMLGQEVAALFVAAEHHREGVGRALLNHVRGRTDSLMLDVFEENVVARAFYERYGFRKIDRRVHSETGRMHLRLSLDRQQGGETEHDSDLQKTIAEA